MTACKWIVLAAALGATGVHAQTAPTLMARPGEFLNSGNYPPAAIRAHAEVKAVARLDIDRMGTVRGCTIDETSGNADLDIASCRAAQKMRFNPARDQGGKAVAGVYRLPVRWTLPVTVANPPNIFQPVMRVSTEVHIGPDGIITGCKVLESVGAPPGARDPCDFDKPGERRGAITNGGKPAGYTEVRTVDVKMAYDN